MNTILNEDQLQQLDIYARKKEEVVCVYLHGSRVKGNAIEDSDLDIAVVVKSKLEINEKLKIVEEIKDIFKLDLEMDIKVVTRNASPVFLFEIIKGVCVYKRSDPDRIKFEAFAMSNYFDTQHMRDIYRQYLYAS